MDSHIFVTWLHPCQDLAVSALLFLFFLMVISRLLLVALLLLSSLKVICGMCPFLPPKGSALSLRNKDVLPHNHDVMVLEQTLMFPCHHGSQYGALWQLSSLPCSLQPGLGITAGVTRHWSP